MGAERGELSSRAGGGGLAGVGDGGVQRVGAVELGNGEFPEVLLQVACLTGPVWSRILVYRLGQVFTMSSVYSQLERFCSIVVGQPDTIWFRSYAADWLTNTEMALI